MKQSNLTAIAFVMLCVLPGCLDEPRAPTGDEPQTSAETSDLCQIDINDCPGWPITVVRTRTLNYADQVRAAQQEPALSQTSPLCAGNSSSTWCGLTIKFATFRIETKCTAQGQPGDNEPITCQSRTCAGQSCGEWTSPAFAPPASTSSRARAR